MSLAENAATGDMPAVAPTSTAQQDAGPEPGVPSDISSVPPIASEQVTAPQESNTGIALVVTTNVLPNAAFSPHHMQVLLDRAVDPQRAADAGLRTVDAPTTAQLLGRSDVLPSGGLAIPYPGMTSTYTRVRMDAGDARYLAPEGVEVPVYVPPRTDAGGTGTLLVVEAPLKALAIMSLGQDAVGLGGVSTTLEPSAPPRLNSSWCSLNLVGRDVVIVFDSNRTTNPSVAHAEARLAVALEAAGAHVTIAQLPPAAPGKNWGPDDFIVAKGTSAFFTVLDGAVPADPVARVRALESLPQGKQAFAELFGDMSFLAAVDVRGAPAEVLLKSSPLMRGVVTEFRKARDKFRTAAKAQRAAANAVATSTFGAEYIVSGGCICVQTVTQQGVQQTALCNFNAQIVENISRADGTAIELVFAVEGVLDTGELLPRIYLPPAEFLKGTWPTEKWGARAKVAATRDAHRQLPLAIQCLSNAPHVTEQTCTGWHLVDGHWCFAHAGGVVIPGRIASVEVRLDADLGRFRLPDHVVDLAAGALHVEGFADLVADDVGLLLLSAVFRAPLFEARPVPGVVYLVGSSGHRKTSVAVVMQCFFGDFTETSLPASWQDTPAALERVFFAAKDCLVVADDVAPKKGDSSDEQRAKASQLIRAIGNVQGRRRMRADMTAQQTYPPRALVVVTGEDVPAEQSIVARSLAVAFGPDSVNLPVLTALQKAGDHLPNVMRAYLEWLAPRYDAIAAHDLKCTVDALVQRFAGKGGHARAGRFAAEIMAGLELYLRFAVEMKLMTRARADELRARGISGAEKVLEAQAGVQQGTDPVRRFLEVAADLVYAGELPIRSLEAHSDKEARPPLAWFDDRNIYFVPLIVYRLVVDTLRKAGQDMPLTDRALFKRLVERGIAHPEGGGHNSVKRAFASTRVLHLDRAEVEKIIGNKFPERPSGSSPSPTLPRRPAFSPLPS